MFKCFVVIVVAIGCIYGYGTGDMCQLKQGLERSRLCAVGVVVSKSKETTCKGMESCTRLQGPSQSRETTLVNEETYLRYSIFNQTCWGERKKSQGPRYSCTNFITIHAPICQAWVLLFS